MTKFITNEILFYIVCLASRFLQGSAAGISVTILYSVASNSSNKNIVNRNIALMETFGNLGNVCGPLIGSFIASHFEYSFAFYLLAILKLLMLMI